MHRHAMLRGHFHHNLVQRQIALDRQTLAQPAVIGGQFTYGVVALTSRCQRPGLSFQDHQVVHELRRHKEVSRRLTMPMPSLNKGDDPAAKLNRMRFTHSDPL